jgi:hypothetical protein
MSKGGDVAMPTIYAPVKGRTYGTVKPGVVSDPKKFDKITTPKLWTAKGIKNVQKYMNFGVAPKLIATPPIGVLKKYGKNFPNGKGLQVKNSWTNTVADQWGMKNITNSGTLGREFGPKGVDKIYSGKYFNSPRMARPGGDLDTALRTNYLAFVNQPPKNVNTRKNVPGLFYDRRAPDFVGFNDLPSNNLLFGKGRLNKRRRNVRSVLAKNSFGSGLYHQMGAPFGRNGVEYLLNPNTVADFYGGATSTFSLSSNKDNANTRIPARPSKVQSDIIYLSKGIKAYNPIKPNLMKLKKVTSL